MSTVASQPMLAAFDTQRPMSYADGQMQKLFQTYFNGRNAAPADLGAGRFDGRSDFQLVDAAAKALKEEANVVIREVNIEYLMWVNRDLMPSRVSRSLEFEVMVLRFDKDVMLEQTPEKAVSRQMDIRKEKLSFRSKRYGLEYEFDVDGMMTEEGQQHFAMFTKKIAQAFRIHAAFIALTRLLMPDSTERHWYSQYGQQGINISDAQILREVNEFAAAHKSEEGVFELIYRYSAVFERVNRVQPDFVIFRPEKQVLFKFQNKKLNEYSRAGPAGPDRLLGADEIASFQGKSYRAFPSFPSAVYNDNEAETSMLAHDIEIGNMFVFRRSHFQNIREYKSGVHNYIEIFSENKDGMHRIHERELLRQFGRWDSNGNLHPYHWEVANQGHREDADPDMFIYYDTQIGRHQVCTHIGDMEEKHFDKQLLSKMVKEALADHTPADMVEVRAAVARLEEDPTDLEKLKRFGAFAAHMGRRLGGARNPVFNGERNPKGNIAGLSMNDKAALTFLDNCFLFHSVAGEDAEVGVDSQRVMDTFRHAIKKLVETSKMEADDLHALVQLDAQVKAVVDAGYFSAGNPNIDQVIAIMRRIVQRGEDLDEADINEVRRITADLPNLFDAGSAEFASTSAEFRKPTAGLRVANAAVPLHFTGYLPEATGATRFGRTPIGYFDDASLYSFGGSTMQKNMADVMIDFPDAVERGVALAILAAPIQLNVWENMLAFNIQVPAEYVIIRPQHHLLMSDMLLCKGGRELGETIIGYGHTGIGWQVENKTGSLHTTQWMGALIRNYAYRCVIRNVFLEESYGGGGHTFFTEQEWEAHVGRRFHTPGYERPSCLVMMIPVDSPVKEDYIFLTGFGPADELGSRPHYHSYHFYNLRYSFNALGNDSASVIYDSPSGPKTNAVCFQGTQRQCGNINGDPGEYIENKGHLGIERPGVRAVRKGGNKLNPVLE